MTTITERQSIIDTSVLKLADALKRRQLLRAEIWALTERKHALEMREFEAERDATDARNALDRALITELDA